jgi:uncharacterized protein (TIGR02271 family)
MTATMHERQAKKQPSTRPAKEQWVDRREERLSVGKEMIETGHVKLHRYVDTEPVEQTVRLSHEEFDVESVPVTAKEPVRGTIGELEQEITLHAERPVTSKETVPVARVRLITKNVQEDMTIRDEIRRERIEIEQDQPPAASNGSLKSKTRQKK